MVAATAASRNSEKESEYDEGEPVSSASEYSESSASSSGPPRKPRRPRKIAGGRYRLGAKLGEGSYSEVYAAVDTKTGENFAAKLEWQKAEKTDKLLKEAELYKELPQGVGLPQVHWAGSQGEFDVMVLDLLGPSLDALFRIFKRFSVKTAAVIGKQAVDLIRQVHSRGILYRDIKPHNFLTGIGPNGSNRIHLVDFGLSKRFLDKDTGEHYKLKCEKGRGIAGTVRYSSPFLHDGYIASRRDDLLAVGYVLLHFLRGDLPWLNVSAKDKKSRNRKIGRRKAETSDAELCEGFPQQFVDYFTYLRSLGFYDEPDYQRLQRLFDDILGQMGATGDIQLDWNLSDETTERRRKRLRIH
eukprot:TRINITY_DN16763_c0_g1_i1.p1 TRINITY_DN16763_c0_g1~~TRINITY_DN16763_c0_g1_i1.p1  ORF type:complete len:367 (-),score=64.75 TRINITY_DN16763_c0_g1_i1:1666-2733(-)